MGLHRSAVASNNYLPFPLGSRMFLPKTVNLRNYVTRKRTDQLKQVKEAVRGALLPCAQRVADENDEILPITRFEFCDVMTKQILDLESDNEVCSG